MHELSIALSVLDALEEQAERHAGAHIAAVHLKIGPLSGVLPDALISAFDLAREQTNFADCQLVIEEIPVTIHCPQCLVDRPVVSIQEMTCTICGTATADVATGRELEFSAMEIDS